QPSWLLLVLEARQLGAMPHRLRRAGDRYPSSHWEPSNDNLVILSGEIVVSSLKIQNGGRVEIGGVEFVFERLLSRCQDWRRQCPHSSSEGSKHQTINHHHIGATFADQLLDVIEVLMGRPNALD